VTSLALRPYQAEDLARIKAALREHRRVVYALPTGAGKTVTLAHLVASVIRNQRRVLMLVHRRELIRQSAAKFAALGIDAGVIAAGWPEDRTRPVQIASVQSLARRMDRLPEACVVLVDEAHHVVARQWSEILDHYSGAYQLGVTATPERLDGKGLIERFRALVVGASTEKLVADG
jgi:superfamily II DNA or RNA helicase